MAPGLQGCQSGHDVRRDSPARPGGDRAGDAEIEDRGLADSLGGRTLTVESRWKRVPLGRRPEDARLHAQAGDALHGRETVLGAELPTSELAVTGAPGEAGAQEQTVPPCRRSRFLGGAGNRHDQRRDECSSEEAAHAVPPCEGWQDIVLGNNRALLWRGRDRLPGLRTPDRWLPEVLFGETLRGPVAPGGDQRFANRALPGGPQPHIRRTAATPAALDRREDRGLGSDEQLLLLGSELHHHPPAAGEAQRRENPTAHAKVRVPQVSGFEGLRQTQGDASKLASGHQADNLRAGALRSSPVSE